MKKGIKRQSVSWASTKLFTEVKKQLHYRFKIYTIEIINQRRYLTEKHLCVYTKDNLFVDTFCTKDR